MASCVVPNPSASVQAAAGSVASGLEGVAMPLGLLPCCKTLLQLHSDTLTCSCRAEKGRRSLLPQATQTCRLPP